jgi:exosortase/archaeosortase family protein
MSLLSNKIKKIIPFPDPYTGVLFFLFLLFFFWGLWKIAISGDMESEYIYFFGKNITPEWFFTACRWLTISASWFIHLFPHTENLVTEDYRLYFPEGGISISIIWGCIGIKQMGIFSGVMACYFGPWKKKLWYIPMGCIVLTIYNIIRIGSITLLTNGHPDKFDSLHDGIFRYIYYTIIFVLWLCWEELIAKKHREHDS